jgi:hypothetical protein
MAFAFLYGSFNRELVVHSVYYIMTVLSRRCRVRSSYRRIYNYPPFFAFYALNALEVLRSGLYLAFRLSKHSAITMRGVLLSSQCVASRYRRRVRSSYPIPISSLYLIFPLPSGD